MPKAPVLLLRAAASYFAVVFGCGFVLGALRVGLLVPRVGVRTAELIELPIMVAIVFLVSRWQQRRTRSLAPVVQLVVGGLALAMMLAAECLLGFFLQGRSPIEVLLAHDPVAGAAYYAALLLFAVLPWWWSRRAPPGASRQQSPS